MKRRGAGPSSELTDIRVVTEQPQPQPKVSSQSLTLEQALAVTHPKPTLSGLENFLKAACMYMPLTLVMVGPAVSYFAGRSENARISSAIAQGFVALAFVVYNTIKNNGVANGFGRSARKLRAALLDGPEFPDIVSQSASSLQDNPHYKVVTLAWEKLDEAGSSVFKLRWGCNALAFFTLAALGGNAAFIDEEPLDRINPSIVPSLAMLIFGFAHLAFFASRLGKLRDEFEGANEDLDALGRRLQEDSTAAAAEKNANLMNALAQMVRDKRRLEKENSDLKSINAALRATQARQVHRMAGLEKKVYNAGQKNSGVAGSNAAREGGGKQQSRVSNYAFWGFNGSNEENFAPEPGAENKKVGSKAAAEAPRASKPGLSSRRN